MLLSCEVTEAFSPGSKVQLKLFSNAVFPDETIDVLMSATRHSIRTPMKQIDPLNLIIRITSPAAVTMSPSIGVRSEQRSISSSLTSVACDALSANRVVPTCSKMREFFITTRKALQDTFIDLFRLDLGSLVSLSSPFEMTARSSVEKTLFVVR